MHSNNDTVLTFFEAVPKFLIPVDDYSTSSAEGEPKLNPTSCMEG